MKPNNLPTQENNHDEKVRFRFLGSEIEVTGERAVPLMIAVLHVLMAAVFCLVALPMLAAMTAHLNNSRTTQNRDMALAPPSSQAMILYQSPQSELPAVIKSAISNGRPTDLRHQQKTTRL